MHLLPGGRAARYVELRLRSTFLKYFPLLSTIRYLKVYNFNKNMICHEKILSNFVCEDLFK